MMESMVAHMDAPVEQIPKVQSRELLIPLTALQATGLTELLRQRQGLDDAVRYYTAAIIAASAHPEGGGLVGVRPAVNGTPAQLVLQALD